MFFVFFFQTFIKINTPQRYNTNATINYKYVTLHYTMNFNGKVTIQKKRKKYVLSTDNTMVQSPKAEHTSY